MKFMFAWRVLNGDACSYRDIFIHRFFRIFNTGIYSCESPTAQFMNICNKYGILQDVYDMILNTKMPEKAEWKKNIFSYVVKRQVMHWRRSLRMYKNLSIYMNVENEYKANVWLFIARYNPKLSKPCNTMIRLLSGCNNLCSYKYHTPERKICINCNLNVKEDIFHFALICDKHNAFRQRMITKIEINVSHRTKRLLAELSQEEYLYVLLGKRCNGIYFKDMSTIRNISVYYINEMYLNRTEH